MLKVTRTRQDAGENILQPETRASEMQYRSNYLTEGQVTIQYTQYKQKRIKSVPVYFSLFQYVTVPKSLFVSSTLSHSPSLFKSISISPSLCQSLSVSSNLSHSLPVFSSFSQSLLVSQSLSQSLRICLSLSQSLSVSFQSLTFSPSFSQSLCLSKSLPFFQIYISFPHSPPVSLSYSHFLKLIIEIKPKTELPGVGFM